MLEQVVSSNAVQIVVTAAMGGLSYLVVARWPIFIAVVAYSVAALLTVSFLFQVGEVYNYSGLYRRAFFHLGDDVTTWLTPIFMWAVLSRQRLVAIAVACGILFSGTKISLVLLVLQYLAIVIVMKGERRALTFGALMPLATAVVVYVSLALVSPYAVTFGNQVARLWTGDVASEPGFEDRLQESVRGRCSEDDCLDAALGRPLRHRAYSAVAGLWMTLQGGFPGSRYPASPEKFADLMIEANPWGINDSFEITRDEWMSIGTVQTPYLQFGAGYGVVLLTVLLAGITGICILGISTIVRGERGPHLAFTVFFLINSLFNQTQPWLGPGPVLFLMGFCAAHISLAFVRQEFASRA